VARLGAVLTRAWRSPSSGGTAIGDDAAVLPAPPGELVLTADAAVAGVHADLSLLSHADLGWKALTAAVSDLAAMGATPHSALLTLCAPPGTDLEGVVAGVADASAAWDCPVVGGDVSTADATVVSVAVVGALDPPAPPAVLRRGAAPGDELFVSGAFGASAAGLRDLRAGVRGSAAAEAHRRPRARLAEGRAARLAGARAMIDVSDGLSIDLHRLADASGVGVVLDRLPVAEHATEDEALGGGEDYELVIATSRGADLVAAFAASGLRAPILMGRCTADPAQRELAGTRLERRGYEHRL